MNPNQLTMIAAYAQAQQIAGHWQFIVNGYDYNECDAVYEWETVGRCSCTLILCDEGFKFNTTANDELWVEVRSLSHLRELIWKAQYRQTLPKDE